jgi:hypothetical protein
MKRERVGVGMMKREREREDAREGVFAPSSSPSSPPPPPSPPDALVLVSLISSSFLARLRGRRPTSVRKKLYTKK